MQHITHFIECLKQFYLKFLEFTDLKLLQKYSNSPFEIWIFYTKSNLNFVCQELSKYIKIFEFGCVSKKLYQF